MYRRSPTILLLFCGLLFFYPLLLRPTSVLYAPGSDLIAQHIPAKLFLVDALKQTGERPLWCPHRFCGDSFCADPQVEAFYPPHLLLAFVPRAYVGCFLSWLVVVHVLLAGLFAYAYARAEGLGAVGAFVAGMGYMFAGKWLLHLLEAGHYIVIGLCWFPLVLLCFEKAVRRRSLAWAVGAGAAYALLMLSTHPQWAAYAAILVGIWSLPAACEGAADRRAIVRATASWLGLGACTGVVALGLLAVQLLPTAEAGRYSTRSQPGAESYFHDEGTESIAGLVGPSLKERAWEDVFAVGLVWLMFAAAALFVCDLRARRVRLYLALVLGITLFAITRGRVAESLPVLRHFRLHFRAFMLVALPLALLVGAVMERIAAALAMRTLSRQRLAIPFVAVCLFAGVAVILRMQRLEDPTYWHPYWTSLAITLPLTFGLLWLPERWQSRWAVPGWCLLLLGDAVALAQSSVDVRHPGELYPPAACIEYVKSRQHERGRTLDIYADAKWLHTPLGPGAPLAMTEQIDAVRGYNPLDIGRFRDYMNLVADLPYPMYPLEVLTQVPEVNRPLLDLLGVRYRIQPDHLPHPGPGWQAVFHDPTPTPAYNYVDGDFPALGSVTVYENAQAFPRAFVVSNAVSLPAHAPALDLMKQTDFRQTVVLESADADRCAPRSDRPVSGTAEITKYLPNQVHLETTSDATGWLVLMDVWHPGWHCSIDGVDVKVYRANYAFRAVELPAGTHAVVFTFAPLSYRVGHWISSMSLVCLGVFALFLLVRQRNHAGASLDRRASTRGWLRRSSTPLLRV